MVRFSSYDDFVRDLEDFKLFAKSKLNFSQGTVYRYSSKIRTFMQNRDCVSDKDIQNYIEKRKQENGLDYVSNIISAFKAYFRDYKGLRLMDNYKHPSSPLRMKQEIEPKTVKMFIEAIENSAVKCASLLLATSGFRKNEVLGLRKGDIDKRTGALSQLATVEKLSILVFHSTMPKQSFISENTKKLANTTTTSCSVLAMLRF